jgi:DNA-binding transcriptional regulator LsrR (DeoR family)
MNEAAGGAPDIKVRVAWLYYVEGLTQEQIARALNISRMRVMRVLAAAREEGIVQIRIEGRTAGQVALERRLIARFGLSEAIVVPSPVDEGQVAAAVGHAAGTWLSDAVGEGMSVAVGWGATLYMSLRAIGHRPLDGVSVVSLMGGMTHSLSVNPSAMARRVADAFGAECYQLTAPVLVSDPALREALWREQGLRELIDRARRADLALISVGDIGDGATLLRHKLLSRSEFESLGEAGAVGDVLCQFIDAGGRLVDHPVNRRTMAVGLDELRRIPRVVIASGGLRKVSALRAALAATQAGVLITDEQAAIGLTQEDHAAGASGRRQT